MNDLVPPNPLRASTPVGPRREVQRSARLRDHENEAHAAPVSRTNEDGRGSGHNQEEPAVVVSHPSAHVAKDDKISGHVVELTPRNQPVLQAASLRLLVDVQLPLPLNTVVELTFVEVSPNAWARIDAVNGETVAEPVTVPVMVLALNPREAASAGAPTSYAPSSAAVRARLMMRESGD